MNPITKENKAAVFRNVRLVMQAFNENKGSLSDSRSYSDSNFNLDVVGFDFRYQEQTATVLSLLYNDEITLSKSFGPSVELFSSKLKEAIQDTTLPPEEYLMLFMGFNEASRETAEVLGVAQELQEQSVSPELANLDLDAFFDLHYHSTTDSNLPMLEGAIPHISVDLKLLKEQERDSVCVDYMDYCIEHGHPPHNTHEMFGHFISNEIAQRVILAVRSSLYFDRVQDKLLREKTLQFKHYLREPNNQEKAQILKEYCYPSSKELSPSYYESETFKSLLAKFTRDLIDNRDDFISLVNLSHGGAYQGVNIKHFITYIEREITKSLSTDPQQESNTETSDVDKEIIANIEELLRKLTSHSGIAFTSISEFAQMPGNAQVDNPRRLLEMLMFSIRNYIDRVKREEGMNDIIENYLDESSSFEISLKRDSIVYKHMQSFDTTPSNYNQKTVRNIARLKEHLDTLGLTLFDELFSDKNSSIKQLEDSQVFKQFYFQQESVDIYDYLFYVKEHGTENKELARKVDALFHELSIVTPYSEDKHHYLQSTIVNRAKETAFNTCVENYLQTGIMPRAFFEYFRKESCRPFLFSDNTNFQLKETKNNIGRFKDYLGVEDIVSFENHWDNIQKESQLYFFLDNLESDIIWDDKDLISNVKLLELFIKDNILSLSSEPLSEKIEQFKQRFGITLQNVEEKLDKFCKQKQNESEAIRYIQMGYKGTLKDHFFFNKLSDTLETFRYIGALSESVDQFPETHQLPKPLIKHLTKLKNHLQGEIVPHFYEKLFASDAILEDCLDQLASEQKFPFFHEDPIKQYQIESLLIEKVLARANSKGFVINQGDLLIDLSPNSENFIRSVGSLHRSAFDDCVRRDAFKEELSVNLHRIQRENSLFPRLSYLGKASVPHIRSSRSYLDFQLNLCQDVIQANSDMVLAVGNYTKNMKDKLSAIKKRIGGSIYPNIYDYLFRSDVVLTSSLEYLNREGAFPVFSKQPSQQSAIEDILIKSLSKHVKRNRLTEAFMVQSRAFDVKDLNEFTQKLKSFKHEVPTSKVRRLQRL